VQRKINIVIAIKEKTKNLKKTLLSISKQTLLPFEVIICSKKKFSIQKLNFNLKIISSPFQNQVFQRNLAIKKLKNKKNILLQLDDRVILEKNALKNLQIKWSKSKNKYFGIGLNAHNGINRGFFDSIYNFLNLKGKIFKVGINTGYQNIKEDIEVEWLSGGASSWKFDKKFLEKENKFLTHNSNWLVGEDVIQSLRKKKSQKLLVCYDAKATILEKSKKQINQIDFFDRGIGNIIWKKKFSKLLNCNPLIFYLFNIPLLLTSLILNLIFFDIKKIKFSLGQLYKIL